MKVLTTSDSAQILEVIPRSYPSSVTIKLRDDSKNTTQTYTVAATNVKGYLRLSNTYSLVEGRFYDLTLLDGSNVIYKDKVFCTDQDVDQDLNEYYSVNAGVYTEEAGDNEFIII